MERRRGRVEMGKLSHTNNEGENGSSSTQRNMKLIFKHFSFASNFYIVCDFESGHGNGAISFNSEIRSDVKI